MLLNKISTFYFSQIMYGKLSDQMMTAIRDSCCCLMHEIKMLDSVSESIPYETESPHKRDFLNV